MYQWMEIFGGEGLQISHVAKYVFNFPIFPFKIFKEPLILHLSLYSWVMLAIHDTVGDMGKV